LWTRDPAVLAAATRALRDELPHVVALRSPYSIVTHLLASPAPIAVPYALAARLPAPPRAPLFTPLPGHAAAAYPRTLHPHRRRADPAISSGVFVTTVTDVVGFFSFLGIATLWFGLK